MRKVKVGQVWKWYSDDVEGFEVTSVDEFDATYVYQDSRKVLTRPLGWWNDYAVLVKDVEDTAEEENNQLSPNVYQFPNGVEVKDISAHLTSFGGQAVQYIARATRLDGVVKGLPIQDLYKAIELLKWEAERMEAIQK